MVRLRFVRKLLALELSMEIFRQNDTQKSISRAKEDIKKGRVKSFDSVSGKIFQKKIIYW